jgi:hypothetical protein
VVATLPVNVDPKTSLSLTSSIFCQNPPAVGKVASADFLALKRVVVLQSILFLFCQPERAVELGLTPIFLHQAVGLESLEVRQVAEGGEAKDLQESLRRDIGERGARLRGADRAVDQAVLLERGNDVASDLASRELGNLPPRDRLQISDGGQGKGLRPGQFRNVIRRPPGMGGANRWRETSFGAQRIAAGDKDEGVRTAAQLVNEVGDQIVEPAGCQAPS